MFLFPVRGETAVISGRKPLFLRSKESIFSITVYKAFLDQFSDMDIVTLPHGYVTVKMKSGEIISLATSHIDCVFDIIPGNLTLHNKPVVLIDHFYQDELLSSKENSATIEKIKKNYNAEFVVIPEKERYLNPDNFILLPDEKLF